MKNYSELVRTDCYLAVIRRFEEKYPNAHFEIVTRQWKNSPLSPTWDLLRELKNGKIDFSEYKIRLRGQIENDRNAMERLGCLKRMVLESRMVFLVCFEKDDTACHRSFLKEILLELFV